MKRTWLEGDEWKGSKVSTSSPCPYFQPWELEDTILLFNKNLSITSKSKSLSNSRTSHYFSTWIAQYSILEGRCVPDAIPLVPYKHERIE